MASVGLERIRDLYNGVAGAEPLKEKDTDEEAIGVVQDFLIEQKFVTVPDHRQKDKSGNDMHGKFGAATKKALRTFFGLKAGTEIELDSPKIKRLINEPPKSARGRIGRLSIKLGFPDSKELRLLSLVSIFEGGFSTLNRNTDKAGLSYGLIQWAQAPGRLHEIVEAMKGDNTALFKDTFGATAEQMVTHISAANNFGVKADGTTTNTKFDLIAPPWDGYFINAGTQIVFQKTQVRLAIIDFGQIVTFVKGYATKIKSQRGIAFMVDLSNQFGKGSDTTGAKGIYKKIVADMPDETGERKLLLAMSKRSVELIQPAFRKAAAERRAFFCDSKFLSNDPF